MVPKNFAYVQCRRGRCAGLLLDTSLTMCELPRSRLCRQCDHWEMVKKARSMLSMAQRANAYDA